MKKIALILLTITFVLSGCSKDKEESFYDRIVREAATAEVPTVKPFENLKIEIVEWKRDGDWRAIEGKVTNNHTRTVEGFFSVTAYDEANNVVDSKLIALPVSGLRSGESYLFDQPISREQFHSIIFRDSSITEQ